MQSFQGEEQVSLSSPLWLQPPLGGALHPASDLGATSQTQVVCGTVVLPTTLEMPVPLGLTLPAEGELSSTPKDPDHCPATPATRYSHVAAVFLHGWM